MEQITVHGKHFIPFIKASLIEQKVKEIADSINYDMAGKNPLFVSILNGSFMFAADLMKLLKIPLEISFVKIRSYQGLDSSGKINEMIGLSEDIRERNIVVVEDIVDTGVTMEYIIKQLYDKGAIDVKIASLLFKPDAFTKSFKIDYCGFSIPDKFVIGFGLDYNGHGRNYPDIYKIVE